jgi:purine nucleosidase
VEKRKIIIDCDPGQDDALALFLALASPDELELLAITTVAGNVPLELTERNARMMCDIAGRTDVKVFAGCERPLEREPISAEHVHGETGINGVDIFEPQTGLQQQHAVDYLVETLGAAADASITLVPTGPLSNIAALIRKDAAVLKAVKEIVLMGGAMREGGNYTPSAEFNIVADPHAADIVFNCGRPITVMGLDVTHQVLSSSERVARIAALGNRVATAAAGMLNYFDAYDVSKYGSDGAPLHDPCTVAFLLRPDLFASKAVNVSVETGSSLTLGHTAVDYWGVSNRPTNCNWVHRVDADGFYDLLTERLARFGECSD